MTKKILASGAALLAGLSLAAPAGAAVSAEAAYVFNSFSFLVCGALVAFAVPLLDKLRIDDVVGAISAHLVAGIWGTLAVGIFGSGDFVVQLIGVLAVGAFVTIASAIVWFAIRAVIGLRIDEEAERLGLDQVELGIEAYAEFGTGSQTI